MNSIELDSKTFTDEALHSACFIDDSGQEIPITPEMIESACLCLADAFQIPSVPTRR